MTTDSTTTVDDTKLFLGGAWSDPIEAGIRDRIRGFIEELIEEVNLPRKWVSPSLTYLALSARAAPMIV